MINPTTRAPEPDRIVPRHPTGTHGGYVNLFTADQMQAYAREALRAQAASVEPVAASDGPCWIEDVQPLGAAIYAGAPPAHIPADAAGWCEYVAGMVDHWVRSDEYASIKADQDRCTKAIAGIIERRLWALKPAPQVAASSPATAVDAVDEREPDHVLKTDPDAFDAVASGIKTHEIRKDDRGFKVGDVLLLKRTRYTGAQMHMRPEACPLEYTGDEVRRTVSHIQRGYGLGDHWVILSFAALAASTGANVDAGMVPLTDEQINEMAIQEQFLLVCDDIEALTEIVRAAELAHGINGLTVGGIQASGRVGK